MSDASPFDQVKSSIDLQEYLQTHKGLDFAPFGTGSVVAPCPFHSERTPSFVVSEGGGGYGRWKCFGGCSADEIDSGSIVDFVMKDQGFLDPIDALRHLDELYDLGLEMNSPEYKRRRARIAENRSEIERTIETYGGETRVAQAAERYLKSRGLSEDTITLFELGVDTGRVKQGRISIPFYDKAGSPLALITRALVDRFPCASCGVEVKADEVAHAYRKSNMQRERGEDVTIDPTACPHCGKTGKEARISWLRGQSPKYFFPKGFDKKNYLYNEHRARRTLVKNPAALGLYICEGYGDVWAGHQAGQEAIVSYNGKVLSEEQAMRIARLYRETGERPVILIPDFDSTGQINVHNNISILLKQQGNVEIRVVYSLGKEEYKDVGELLQGEGPEETARVLRENTISATEWKIRTLIEKRHPEFPDRPFYTREKQQELITDELRAVKHSIELDHLIPYLATAWDTTIEQAGLFLRTYIGARSEMGGRHLMRTIHDAYELAKEWVMDDHVLPHGFLEIDSCLPGGGAKLQQLAMFLGKSGTGKALRVDEPVLMHDGTWKEIGQLTPGELVMDSAGEASLVMGVYPQGVLPAYKLTLEDGGSIVCSGDHLWAVRRKGTREMWVVTTTEALLETGIENWEIPSPNISILKQARTLTPVGAAYNWSQDRRYRARDSWERPGRAFTSSEKVDDAEMVCIAVSAEDRLFITRDLIITHNTMLATQIMSNQSRMGIPCIIFSLEQPTAQLYMRMACQTLGVGFDDVVAMLKSDDPKLRELDEVFENLVIIDNVPNSDGIVEPMTPSRVGRIIQETNMYLLKKPAQCVAIDHLGIMAAPDDAPESVKRDDMQASGYIMQELFSVCKTQNVYMMVLQQLPKEVPPGVEFGYDAGRGSSKQTDYCDYIYCIWRPEMQVGLTADDKRDLTGQYKLKVSKNRHGKAGTGHLWFDTSCMRITPAIDIPIAYDSVEEVVRIEGEEGSILEEGPPVMFERKEGEEEIIFDSPEVLGGTGGVKRPSIAGVNDAATIEEPQENMLIDNKEMIDGLAQQGYEIDPEMEDWLES